MRIEGDPFKAKILEEHLKKMKKDEYYLVRAKGDEGHAINLSEAALTLLKQFYTEGIEEDSDVLKRILFEFLKKHTWEQANVPEQARAIFTTLCIAADLEADTLQCDNLLLEIFNDANPEGVSYEEWENFMLAYIV